MDDRAERILAGFRKHANAIKRGTHPNWLQTMSHTDGWVQPNIKG